MDENPDSLQPNSPQGASHPPVGSSGPAKTSGVRSGKWLIGTIIVLALIIVALVAYALHYNAGTKTSSTTSTSTSPVTITQSTPASQTDNASLQQDVNDIDSRMNQSSQDQAANDTSLSDQQNQISVPTN